MRSNFIYELNSPELTDSNTINSFIFISKEEKPYANSFLFYLRRIGFSEQCIPRFLVKMSEQNQLKDEQTKNQRNICPFIKSFGKCIETQPSAMCKFRHNFNPTIDSLVYLDETLRIPDEGYIKFKVMHVEDTNHIFINIHSHQDLKREITTDYDHFLNFDIELQSYYSNQYHIVYNTDSFNISELYAFKDITNGLFKRIRILQVTKQDLKIAYEVLAQCIDYGVKLIVNVHDLIKLPMKFQSLPAQAVEVFFCDIRPIDRDINYSTASKLFIAEKLNKSKEFIGKIQLAAGNTLWLHPVSSFKHLKQVKLAIIDDCIRSELVSHNFATSYLAHLNDLKQLFSKNKIKIARQEDESMHLETLCIRLLENLYENFKMSDNDSQIESIVAYAFLEKKKLGQLYVSAVETPAKFYIQNAYSNRFLERLNGDIKEFLNQLKSYKLNIGTFDINNNNNKIKNNNNEIFEQFEERTKQIRSSLNKKTIDHIKKVYNKKLFCLAKLKSENEYFRAEIKDFKDETNEIRVFYVDFGDYSWVNLDEIYPLNEKFLRILPFQAIECSLGNFSFFLLLANKNDYRITKKKFKSV